MSYVRVGHSVVSDSATPWTVALQAPLSMEISRQEYWNGLPFSSLGHLHPGIETGSPTLQADSFWSEPTGKPMSYAILRLKRKLEVGSLSLLQGNFLTQESNQGLLHCRRILYQLSYPGSPELTINVLKQIN